MRLQNKIIVLMSIWCGLIFLTPLIAHILPMVGVYLYVMFSPLCHQIPERSFMLLGLHLPVCARCTGIYGGGFAGSFFVKSQTPSPWILVAALLPLGIDGVTQLVFRESTNWIRFITGCIAGFAVIFYVYPGLHTWKK
jgi:uncharacterized membrane protein